MYRIFYHFYNLITFQNILLTLDLHYSNQHRHQQVGLGGQPSQAGSRPSQGRCQHASARTGRAWHDAGEGSVRGWARVRAQEEAWATHGRSELTKGVAGHCGVVTRAFHGWRQWQVAELRREPCAEGETMR
jgi:hypothetical protein